MKTLVVNGSPKEDGDTAALLGGLVRHLDGEVLTLTAQSDISPCVDCRYCWQKPGCSIDDEMQRAYSFLETCDNVVLASPIWFSSLSGPLLNIASRLQTCYAGRRFRGRPYPGRQKKGALVLVGAQAHTAPAPTENALSIMGLMHVNRDTVKLVCALDTDSRPAGEDAEALEQARLAALFLNGRGV